MAPPVARLQRSLRGPVLDRHHPAYDVARTTFNGMTDRHPEVIACCAGNDDVTAARLQQVKRRYDPHNLFRFNHNIPPAVASA